MIEIRGLSKSYNKGKVKAVDNLSLQVKPGEIFGFLGPNGAGKTTTIKMMVGLLNPDEGSIKINGFDVRLQTLEAKMSIGYAPDNPDVYERLTGLEYLNFIADVYQVPSDTRRQRMNLLLDMFGLTDAASDLIKSYSHGMKQKIVLTGALIHNPRLWILDEPMVGLDPKSASISREGQTFWISKMIPVSPRIQVLSKILHSAAISLIGVLATGLVLIFLLKFSVLRVVILLLLGIMGAFLLVIYSLMIDVLHPKLFWTNPQEAVKQNLNGLFGLLLTLLILVVLAAFSIVLILIKANVWIILPALGIFILLLILPGYFGLLAMAESKYNSIEM